MTASSSFLGLPVRLADGRTPHAVRVDQRLFCPRRGSVPDSSRLILA